MRFKFLNQHFLSLSFFLTSIMLEVRGQGGVKNLTQLTWSHGTNSQEKLNTVLASDIDFIEADIVYGYLKDDELKTERQPIMAHPPDEESDLTLESFLTQIWSFNEKAEKDKQKGVKLDFKSTDVFLNSLQILTAKWNSNYDIWLNADIIRGPQDSTNVPVDADIFLSESKKFPSSTLSTGWTTRWGSNFTEGTYTAQQVSNMINALKRNDIKNPITFPVRAGIAAQSLETLTTLYQGLNGTNSITFTIWSSDDDSVNVENLRKMIFHFGLDKVYVDVPKALSDQLRLDIDPGNNSQRIKLNVLIGSVALILSSMFAYMFK